MGTILGIGYGVVIIILLVIISVAACTVGRKTAHCGCASLISNNHPVDAWTRGCVGAHGYGRVEPWPGLG